MKIENEYSFKHMLIDGCNLFLGSAFSILANDDNNNPLPMGQELLSELISIFSLKNMENLSLAQVSTILMHEHKKEFQSFIKKRFTVGQYNQHYKNLEHINLKAIFTTNVDNLLYKIFISSKQYYLNDLDIKGPVFNDRKAIDVITLHGCVLDDNRPLSFNSTEVASAFHTDPDRWNSLTNKLQKYPTLFWGYGMNDSGTLEALSPISTSYRPLKDIWVTLAEDDSSTVQYFQALGCQIIIATTDEMLSYLGEIDIKSPSLVSKVHTALTKDLFPTEALPEIGSVPVRPIIEFYLGAAPSWSDIFSGNLYKISYFNKIRDLINSGKNTIVIGIAGCGKTTLMMQVAQEISFNGHKLICEAPTIEKAGHITNSLSGNNALIFVDNFADSADSFEYLSNQENIIVVGFDREYNFENVSNRISLEKCNILDVTELSSHDVQEILLKIPENVKSPYINTRNISDGPPPSLFEIIEANINRPNLKKRFESVLFDIERQDKNLLDLLLASCYVHYCHTPISMDMLIALLRDVANNYQDIYRMCNRLKPMISDYYGPFADEEQDYWIPRSIIVSEAILNQASSSMLKRMLLRFLRQVSPYRIHRFDIFRRRAFDATFMARAFPKWEEGKNFYEETLARNVDVSYFLKQQGALYLSHKTRFAEAFSWIDDAVIQSGGRILSIRNSHAVILFKANVNKDSTNPTVRRTLEQSMDILSECYNQDRRKTHHALTFADQARQYWDIFADTNARGYLETALKWLKEEEKNSPWNRAVRRLIKEISDKLRI